MDVLASLVSAVIGAAAATMGQYLLNLLMRRKERKEGGKVVECAELVNERRSKEEVFGPMAGRVRVKIPKEGPDSELIEIEEWYYSKFRFRNLSDAPVPEVRLRFDKAPVWYSLKQGGQKNPDWEDRFRESLKEKGDVSGEGFTCSIPYINPYYSTKHEVFLELASYVSLTDVKINGGAKGVYFAPCKKTKEKEAPRFVLFASRKKSR